MTPADRARQKIVEALIEFIEAQDDEPVELIGDWYLIAHLPAWEGDLDVSNYFSVASTDGISTHVMRGLLETAIETLR